MPDFGKLAKKAKELVSKHPDAVDKAIDRAGQFAEEKTGGRFSNQIETVEQQAERYLGTGQADASNRQQAGQTKPETQATQATQAAQAAQETQQPQQGQGRQDESPSGRG